MSSGRTDAGVHALAQVATFSTTSRLNPETFMKALNALLPREIRIIQADSVPGNFHPRYNAKRKRYFYIIVSDSFISPFFFRYAHHVKHDLDISLMSTAANYVIGRHDFKSFSASETGVKTTVREVFTLKVEKLSSLPFAGIQLKGNLIKISIEADGFLRHMVRNIIGTLIEVGREKIEPARIEFILLKKDRCLSGPTAPGNGLFLEKVFY